ncbi:MAG: 4-hydroxy-3-methylbut-2-en-1-yl diphosphate synthase [Candidatus Cloacimonetes bacterium 4572_65]|nr:MAG: 4-hydroxy-3-methylbut-2-en-1-yl diphosphate synthase [Candidatus Cloacimonetes bacterium 4572_65]
MIRKQTNKIKLGDIYIGGDAPITVQSMTNTNTADAKATIDQIKLLESAGCEIIRFAVPDMESATAIKLIKKEITIPTIADIHFDYKLALASIENGVDGLRLNPGNIGETWKVKEVIKAASERDIPIRIGVNGGSLSKRIINKFGFGEEAIVESALEHVRILEDNNYNNIKISVKSSDIDLMVRCYRSLSDKINYPLHLGVTEAGTVRRGTIKSALGIGTLLYEGIGDTLRVSLTSSPVEEVKVGREILLSLGLRDGLKIISCPTCGRTKINLISLAEEVEIALAPYKEHNITVAVMGCIVNGPGEAREADYGLAGGFGEGLLFKKGEIVATVPENMLVEELLNIIKSDLT